MAILDLHGDLVADSADEMLEQARLVTVRHKYLALDLTNVGFMDSSGLRACMQTHTLLAGKGGLAAFACANDNVGRVFRMTRADQKLAMASSRPAAIKKLNDSMAGGAVELDDAGAGQVVQIKLGQDLAEITSARATIREYCESRFTEPACRSTLDDFYLATTEAMNNAVKHSGSNNIGIAVGAAKGMILFKMVTTGARFDPTGKKTMPDLDSGEKLPEGGFGLAIIQKCVDSVAYEYRDGKNILTLKKTIDSRNAPIH